MAGQEADVEDKLRAYREAIAKGVEFILSHANPDGSVGPVDVRLFYYRLPWALARAGKLAEGARLVDWILKNQFTKDGSLEGLSPRAVFDTRYGSYPASNFLMGAALFQRHDIVQKGVEDLLKRWVDPKTGGSPNVAGDAGSEQEIMTTSQCGMTLLATGRVAEARKCGDFLVKLWELQPTPETCLYNAFNPVKDALVTEGFPADAEVTYVVRKDKAACLAELYLATGEQVYLTAARGYQEFSMTTAECQFQSKQISRQLPLFNLGSGEQLADGHWENTKKYAPNPSLADNLEITTEFVLHLCNIVCYAGLTP